jgi:hypothetical protein
MEVFSYFLIAEN